MRCTSNFRGHANTKKRFVRLLADLNCSVEGVLPSDFVFDHFGGRLDRLNFCRLVVGEYFALLISKDGISLYDVKMEPGHLLKRSDAMPVPPKQASARKNGRPCPTFGCIRTMRGEAASD